MLKVVCSVYDRKAALYSNPFYAVNDLVAGRDFMRGCSDPNSDLSVHPEDYSLYKVATFDDVSGLFTPVIPPEFLLAANSNFKAFSETQFPKE